MISQQLIRLSPSPLIAPLTTPPLRALTPQLLPVLPQILNHRIAFKTRCNQKKVKKIFAISGDIPGDDEELWVRGVDDPLLAELVTMWRKSTSASVARKLMNASVVKLGIEVASEDPLWAELVAEAGRAEKLWSDFAALLKKYMMERRPAEQSPEDFINTLRKAFIPLDHFHHIKGRVCSQVVFEWMIKHEPLQDILII